MQPKYFYVVDLGESSWEVKTHEAKPASSSCFASYDAALAAATSIARQLWQRTQSMTGVRVWEALGGWTDERVFGMSSALVDRAREDGDQRWSRTQCQSNEQHRQPNSASTEL
jgi:hypothetical protein